MMQVRSDDAREMAAVLGAALGLQASAGDSSVLNYLQGHLYT